MWKTPFTTAFQCRLPILSAPMAGAAGGLLAARVCKAGGLGMIAAGHFQDVSKLENEIKIFEDELNLSTVVHTEKIRESQHTDLAIGFLGFSSLAAPKGWKDYEYILRKYRPKVVQFFAPTINVNPAGGPSNVQLAHQYGAKFIAQVGSVKEAKVAIQHEVNAIICQGSEAGGHGIRRELGNSTMSLASQVSNMTDIPVLAAGGIVNGKHVAAALAVCDGVSIGTRFWACSESIGNKKLQQALIKNNSCDDVIRTAVFDQIQNEFAAFKWPYPYDSSGALRNQTSLEWGGQNPDRLQNALEGLILDKSTLLEDYKSAQKSANAEIVAVLAGEGVGEIDSIEDAYNVLLRIEEEAMETINRLKSLFDG